MRTYLSFITLLLLVPVTLRGQQEDSLYHQMDSIEVKAFRIRSHLRSAPHGELHWNLDMMKQLPQVLGNADPIHYLQLLPSVQTNSEFDAGIHIQGCSTGQSLTQIGDAPIYNPSHLLGIFSTFNAMHYEELVFRSFSEASTPNILGGTVQMIPRTAVSDSVSGTISLGMLSMQGSLQVPLSHNQSLVVSGRHSFFNLFYGNFTQIDGSRLDYSFYDYNISYALTLTRHRISIDAFYSHDRGKYGERRVDLGLDLFWQNYMASMNIDSQHQSGVTHQSVYFSGYENRVKVSQSVLEGKLPSYVRTLGYKFQQTRNLQGKREQQLCYGMEFQQHHIQPQDLNVEATYQTEHQDVYKQDASHIALFADYALRLTPNLEVRPGLRFNAYRLWNDNPATFFHPDPFLTFTLNTPQAGTFHLRLNRQHQYIHQAGFSSVGLPTEYRFSCSSVHRPQSSLNLSLDYEHDFFERRFRVKAEIYRKTLQDQIEFHGDIMAFYGFSSGQSLIKGKGYNYGINIQLIKQTGRLTGWLSYAYNRSTRNFNTLNPDKWYPSNYERPHELNAVVNYHLNKHWTFGGTFVFASGTPFTSVKYAYFIAHQLAAQYGEHNANRLAPYCRTDVSVSYDFNPIRSRLKHGVNLSVYNVFYNKNEVFCKINFNNEYYNYRPVTFFIRTLPSISYYIKF